MQARLPRTLILGPASPLSEHAGSAFIKSLVATDSECFLWMVINGSPETPGRWQGTPVMSFPTLSRRSYAPYAKVSWLLQRALFRAHRLLGARQYRSFGDLLCWFLDGSDLAYHLLRLCERLEIEVIWVILEASEFTGLFALKHLLASQKVKVALNIHDPPVRSSSHGLARWLRPLFESRLRHGLQQSHALAMASPEMAATLGCPEAQVLIPGHRLEELRPAAIELRSPGDLFIGFLGTLYALEPWRALLAALDEVEWKLGDRRVKLRYIGNPGQRLRQDWGRRPIEVTGWVSQDECLQRICKCDVGYLPYWFDRPSRVEQCFPSKLTSYLAAGIPVLYHGPELSTPARFLHRYQAGVICASLSGATIRQALGQLVAPERYALFAGEAHRAALEEFNLEEFHRRARDFLSQALSKKP